MEKSLEKIETNPPSTRKLSWFSHFYEITPIHGFRFILDAQNRLESTFWYFALLISLGFVLSQIVQLIWDFSNRSTLTKVTLQINQSMTFPSIVFCIIGDVSMIYGKNRQFDDLKDNLLDFELSDKNKPWSDKTVQLSWEFMANLSSLENLRFDEKFLTENDEMLKNFDVFVKYLQNSSLNGTFESFSSEFATKLLEKLKFSAIFENYLVSEIDRKSDQNLLEFAGDNPEKTKLVEVSSEKLCVLFNFSTIKQEKLEPSRLILELSKPQEWNEIPLMFLEFLPRNRKNWVPTKLTPNKDLRFRFGNSYNLDLSLEGIYYGLPHTWPYNNQNCDRDTFENEKCRLDCLTQAFRDNCPKCHLLSSVALSEESKQTEKKSLCIFSDYKDCLANNVSKSDKDYLSKKLSDKNCERNCAAHCEQWVFRVERTVEKAENDKMKIQLEYDSFKYPIYTECEAENWRTLLGCIGGSVALFLGASVISLIHCILYGFKWVKSQWSGRSACSRKVEEIPVEPAMEPDRFSEDFNS